MISDENKNITNLTYNHLNLPVEIVFPNGNITYLYNATGQKVKKIVTEGTAITTTDYLSNFQYKNTILQFFPHAEGYVNAKMIKTSYKFNYVFNFTDHLGNIRLSYTKDPVTNVLKIIEENHYYPFGLKHTNYNSDMATFKEQNEVLTIAPTNTAYYKYKYLGQELQDELGLNWYSYKWRNADPALGRFFGIDPISENYYYQTNYQFASNNPVWKIEIEGLEGKNTNNGTDLKDANPVFLNSNIILNTVVTNQSKNQNLKNNIPIIEMGLGYDASKSYTYGNEIANANTAATAVNGNVCYSVCRNGEIVSYQLDAFQIETKINLGGENVYGEKFTTMSASGSYNLKDGTSNSKIDLYTSQTGTTNDSDYQDSVFGNTIIPINVGPAFVNFNIGAMGNGLVDFGNLVMSWLDSVVKENFGGGGDANPLNN